MNKNTQNFITDLIEKCQKNGITLKLVGNPFVKIGKSIKCTGFFDEVKKELVVAIDNPLNIWLSILVHESSHMDQSIEKTKIWVDARDCNDYEPWLSPSKTKVKSINEIFIKNQMMELDAEKRAIKKIEEYNLPLNKKDYIRKANAYILSYRVTKKNREWFKFPYKIPEIYENMPCKFLTKNKYLDDKNPLLNLFKKELQPK